MWQPETVYLDTASYGLPPAPAWDALQTALAEWRTGRRSWEHWGDATDAARREFAALVAADPAAVAVGATVSGLVGTVAASLPKGARVLAIDEERVVNELGVAAIHEHDLRLANRFRAGRLRASFHVYNTDADVDAALEALI